LAIRGPRPNAPRERSRLILTIHPNACTTPAVRAEIAPSRERSGVLAERYGVSTETIRKWRQRGPEDCRDRSRRPRRLPPKAAAGTTVVGRL
jgi:transposase-like protein